MTGTTDQGCKFRLGAEFVGLFIGLPLLVLALKDQVPVLLPLGLIALACAAWIWRDRTFDRNCLRGECKLPRKSNRGLFLVFAILATTLVAILWEEAFLYLPRERPELWLSLLLVYPVLSVIPQEFIYRTFFFHRFQPLFGNGPRIILASAFAFAFAHIVYQNWLAVSLCFAGGIIFARTYAQTRSLPAVCLEHTAYGLLLFTIGLAPYFGLEHPAPGREPSPAPLHLLTRGAPATPAHPPSTPAPVASDPAIFAAFQIPPAP